MTQKDNIEKLTPVSESSDIKEYSHNTNLSLNRLINNLNDYVSESLNNINIENFNHDINYGNIMTSNENESTFHQDNTENKIMVNKKVQHSNEHDMNYQFFGSNIGLANNNTHYDTTINSNSNSHKEIPIDNNEAQVSQWPNIHENNVYNISKDIFNDQKNKNSHNSDYADYKNYQNNFKRRKDSTSIPISSKEPPTSTTLRISKNIENISQYNKKVLNNPNLTNEGNYVGLASFDLSIPNIIDRTRYPPNYGSPIMPENISRHKYSYTLNQTTDVANQENQNLSGLPVTTIFSTLHGVPSLENNAVPLNDNNNLSIRSLENSYNSNNFIPSLNTQCNTLTDNTNLRHEEFLDAITYTDFSLPLLPPDFEKKQSEENKIFVSSEQVTQNNIDNYAVSKNRIEIKKLPLDDHDQNLIYTDQTSNSEENYDNISSNVLEDNYPKDGISKNYDFKIVESFEPGPFAPNSLHSGNDFKNNATNESFRKIKFDIDSEKIRNNPNNILSRFSSNQLTKFFEVKFHHLFENQEEFNIIMEKLLTQKLSKGQTLDLSDNRLLSTQKELFDAWDTTKPSLKIHHCECHSSIWYGQNLTPCIYQNTELKSNYNLNEKYGDINLNPSHNHEKNKKTDIKSHVSVPFSIELLHNYVLSILLNKKLRSYLKKTIRPPKKSKQISKYLNLIQDGNIYKDSIKNFPNIDFALTFSMVTPTLLGINVKTGNLGFLCFVLNELPEHLRYKPEFVFLASIFDMSRNSEWNRAMLSPLFGYLSYLRENLLKVNLNKHEYRIRIDMIIGMTTPQSVGSGILEMRTASFKYQCAYCKAPRITIRNNLGHEYKPIYSSQPHDLVTYEEFCLLKKRGALISSERSEFWSLSETPIVELLKNFDMNRCIIMDVPLWIMQGVFKQGLGILAKKYFKVNVHDGSYELFKKGLQALQTSILRHKILDNPKFLIQCLDPLLNQTYFFSSLADLSILQSVFPLVYSIYFDKMYQNPNEMNTNVSDKFRVLSLLIELNAYVGALFATEVEKVKVPILQKGFKSLLNEIENLSKFESFKNLNLLLMLPLHYMSHLYERWNDFGDFGALSLCKMDNAMTRFKKLTENGAIDKNTLSDRVRALNIYNCVQIYNYAIPAYPEFNFFEYKDVIMSNLSEKSIIKTKEFNTRFLFEALDHDNMEPFIKVESINSFELNSVIINPERRPTAANLVRIKFLKKGLNWKFVHIYGMYRLSYTNPYTKEKIMANFIEFKETQTKKRFQKVSNDRPPFTLGEYLSLKSPTKELRCLWLDDIQMVALRVFSESYWIYDPKMLLARTFDI